MASGWTTDDIPDLSGKTILITGANSGLGYEAALALAGKGAQVLLACRDEEKGRAAEVLIRGRYPHAATAVVTLDLADLADIRRAATAIGATYPRLHVLMNNAGVMALPYRQTADRENAQTMIEWRVALRRRDDTERNADHDGDQHCGERELDRRRQPRE